MTAARAKRSSVQLYSWFVEPITNRQSKRWNGNVRVWGLQTPDAKTWWRSSSVANATSPTHLVTRFGTNVFLHGTLSEKFAVRLHMNAAGMHMFQTGFPSSWKQRLLSCFSQISAFKWTHPLHHNRRATNTVSILKKNDAQPGQRAAKRKRVQFDINLQALDVPCPPSKRARVSHVSAPREQPSSPPVSSQPPAPRSEAAPAPKPPSAPKASQPAPLQTKPNKPLSSKRISQEPRKRATSRRTLNTTTIPSSTRASNSRANTRIAIPIANSSHILHIRRSTRLERQATDVKRRHRSQPPPSKLDTRKLHRTTTPQTHSLPPSQPTVTRARRSASEPPQSSQVVSSHASQPHLTRARRRSLASDCEHEPKLVQASARVDTSHLQATQRNARSVHLKPDASSESKSSSQLRRRSPRHSDKLSTPRAKSQCATPRLSHASELWTHPTAHATRRSKRIEDQRSVHSEENKEQNQLNKHETAVPSSDSPSASDSMLDTDERSGKLCNASDQKSSTQQRRKRRRRRGSKKKNSPKVSESKSSSQEEQQSNGKQTTTRRSTRARVRAAGVEAARTDSTTRRKRVVVDVTIDERQVRTSTRQQTTSGKQTKSEVPVQTKEKETKTKVSVKSQKKQMERKVPVKTEKKPRRTPAVRFADESRPVLRPRKRVSFGPETKSGSVVPLPDGGFIESWSAKQREEFERQRNRVPANDPHYWERVAAGVQGKTAAQCIQLWDSSWSSPPGVKRKQVSFSGSENEQPKKKPKVSTPQVIQNVQKASKSKRGRSTAKYRTSVRRLADTFARDTEDDALEPEIVTPKMSCKLTTGRFDMPELQDGTPGTEVRQKRRNADKGGELATPEILKRGKSFGLREADQYVSLFRQRLGTEAVVRGSKQVKPGICRDLAKKPPRNISQAHQLAEHGDGTSLSNEDSSQESDYSSDGDLFF